MILDCHVHISAFTPGRGSMSPRLLRSIPFRFLRWRFGLEGADGGTERALERVLARTVEEASPLDAAVILAFDAVYRIDGTRDAERTHFYVANDYVRDLARSNRKLLYGASVHPYRRDAVAELERCVQDGAVLIKWLPITQDFNPADERCFPFYEALAHHRMPLLSHTGGEQTLPRLNLSVADPALLEPALQRGVTVIAAHCGTRSLPNETDFLPSFMRLAREYEHCYGDTSALNMPTRSYGYDSILRDEVVRGKLVHGSDWPIISVPPFTRVGWRRGVALLRDQNWMRRDIRIKEALGLDDAYWQRAGQLLRR